MKIKIKKEKILTVISIFYLIQLYLFAEQIRFVTILTSICLFFYILIYRKKIKIVSFKQISIWSLYFFIGTIPTVLYEYSMITDFIEFFIGIFIVLIMTSFYQDQEARKYQVKGILIICYIVLLGCFLQIFFPNNLIEINKLIMGSEKFFWFLDFYNSKFMLGFSYQTAITAFYLTILIMLLYSKILYQDMRKKRKILLIVIEIISFILLFQTGKRIFIGLIFLIKLILLFINKKQNIFKIIIYVMMSLLILLVLLKFTIIGERLIHRMLSEDISRGRFKIYEQLLRGILNYPILGLGLRSTLTQLKGYSDAHNIYLQIFYETGIIGFFILISLFLFNLYRAMKEFKIRLKKREEMVIVNFCVVIQLLFLGWGVTGNPLYSVYSFMMYMFSVNMVESLRYERLKSYKS